MNNFKKKNLIFLLALFYIGALCSKNLQFTWQVLELMNCIFLCIIYSEMNLNFINLIICYVRMNHAKYN